MTTDAQGHKVLVCDNGTGVSSNKEFVPHDFVVELFHVSHVLMDASITALFFGT